MKKILKYILSLPILAVCVVFDIIKLPIILVLFLPVSVFLFVIDWLRSDVVVTPISFCWESATVGIQIWLELVE